MNIEQTSRFAKSVKKLHPNQKKELAPITDSFHLTNKEKQMTTRDQYMATARELTNYMNAWRLAFKSYAISELDTMIKATAGESARVSTASAAESFESCLQERGFVVFPSIKDNQEGYVRIYRASSKIGNLLSAFRYPGPNGDNELSNLLLSLSRARRPDAVANEDSDVG